MKELFRNKYNNMKGFAVQPKLDCPHLSQLKINELSQYLLNTNTKHFSQFECASCKDKSENWICLQCRAIACSRYVQGHMSEHHDQSKHSIALSFSDSSFWCYDCESYIDHPTLIKARREFSKSKFASTTNEEETKKQTTEAEQQKLLEEEFKKLEVSQEANAQPEKKQDKVSYEEIIEGLKTKKYKKVIFLTGAGLSVGAGIPDFRTPGTGLYSQLQKFNLPRPESIFELAYYASNPLPFIKLCKQWEGADFKPTDGHKFIKKLEDENLLYYCMTQNIDDLETKAGVSPQKLIQAHGHSRTAHCIKCKKQVQIQEWMNSIKKQEPLKCIDCSSLVKPDIVFFGEQLPTQFFKCPQYVEEADLVFVIGTALCVFPFAFLAHKVPADVPLVLINNTDSLPQRTNKLWMDGDIQENIRRICKDIDWTL